MFKQELIRFAENLFEVWEERKREDFEDGVDELNELLPNSKELESIVEETMNKIKFEDETRDFYKQDKETRKFFRRLIKK